MFTLSILPNEMKIPLDDAGCPGATAIARPIDIIDASQWRDAFPSDKARNAAATELVRAQLLRIEGLQMRGADQSVAAYDHSNTQHFRSLPADVRTAIYNALMARVNVSGEQEKNSDSPSVSDGTASSESSPAAPAASEPETS
jgi:hypothetical protein